MEIELEGVVIEWRGPSPYHFVALPPDAAAEVEEVRHAVTYGWGVVPVAARIGATSFTTSLIPKDGGFLLPVKDAVRRAEGLTVGSPVQARVTLAL